MTALARRSRRWVNGIALAFLAALLLGGFLMFRARLGGTTLTVTNVGDRPVDGVVILAVAEGSEDVRREWAIGTLRPGEAKDVDGVFAADTNLAIRIRTAKGGVAEDRLRIYLGSPSTLSVRVEVAVDGVVRAHVRHSGWDDVIEREDIQRGLEPRAPGSPTGPNRR